MGKEGLDLQRVQSVVFRKALIVIEGNRPDTTTAYADILEQATDIPGIFAFQFPDPGLPGLSVQYHQQARFSILAQHDVTLQVSCPCTFFYHLWPVIDPQPLQDVAPLMPFIASFSLSASMPQVFKKPLVRPVGCFLGALHPPDPLVDPFCGDKIGSALLALHRDQFRRAPGSCQPGLDKLPHPGIKNRILGLLPVPFLRPGMCRSSEILTTCIASYLPADRTHWPG